MTGKLYYQGFHSVDKHGDGGGTGIVSHGDKGSGPPIYPPSSADIIAYGIKLNEQSVPK